MDKVAKLASENNILILSKSTCCLCYAVQKLIQELGAKPYAYDIEHDPEGMEMEEALIKMGCEGPVPAVFIGGKLVGSTNEIMSMHLNGSLMPLLRPYLMSR